MAAEQIKPIETVYNGYRFRSRLEARWAVFFDAVGIPYLYEPEGVKLSDGTFYLPDFYLPNANVFFECKGVLHGKDTAKIFRLAHDLQHIVVVGYDDFKFDIAEQEPWEGDDYGFNTSGFHAVMVKCRDCKQYFFIDWAMYYWECPSCGLTSNKGNNGRIHDIVMYGDSGCPDDRDVENAIMKAKQARFEHGEQP